MTKDPTSEVPDGDEPEAEQSKDGNSDGERAAAPDAEQLPGMQGPPRSLQGLSSVVALQASKIFQWAIFNFPRIMANTLDAIHPPPLSKPVKTRRKRLLDVMALAILDLAWKESTFVTDSQIKEAGLVRSFANRPFTRHAIGNALWTQFDGKDKSTKDSYLQWANRIVDSAFFYGMLENDVAAKQNGGKPIKATARLDVLMREIGVTFGETIANELKGNGENDDTSGPGT